MTAPELDPNAEYNRVHDPSETCSQCLDANAKAIFHDLRTAERERDDLRERLAKAEGERDEAREECEEHRRQYEAESQTSYALERKLDAAANPATVLALLDRIGELEAEPERVARAEQSQAKAWAKYRALKAQVRALVFSQWPAGSVEREPLEQALRAALNAEVGT